MARHKIFRDACVRFLEENGEANIEDICAGLKTSRGTRFSTRQMPVMKAAHMHLNRDKRIEKVSINPKNGGRTSVYRLRKRGEQ